MRVDCFLAKYSRVLSHGRIFMGETARRHLIVLLHDDGLYLLMSHVGQSRPFTYRWTVNLTQTFNNTLRGKNYRSIEVRQKCLEFVRGMFVIIIDLNHEHKK